MLIQVLSDLHLETYPSYSHYKHKLTAAPYLALLGDIGHVCKDSLFELFRRLLDHYFVVFYLMGNHDPKDLTMEAAKARVRKFEQTMARTTRERTIGKFVFLDQSRYDLDSTLTILGSTLFSRVTDEQKAEVGNRMVDFRDTKGWTVADHNQKGYYRFPQQTFGSRVTLLLPEGQTCRDVDDDPVEDPRQSTDGSAVAKPRKETLLQKIGKILRGSPSNIGS